MQYGNIAIMTDARLATQLANKVSIRTVQATNQASKSESAAGSKGKSALDSDVATISQTPPKPPMYGVLIINDDYTPMDFVIFVLERFFAIGLTQATELMLSVHYKGKAMVGVYPRDIASTKAKMVNDFSREQGHPLLCQVEKLD